MVCTWRNFQKKILRHIYLLKPQISSIFHFDRVSEGRMAHVLGVIEGETRSNLAAPPERFKPKDPQRCKITTSWRRYTHSAAPASMGSPEASAKERLHFFFLLNVESRRPALFPAAADIFPLCRLPSCRLGRRTNALGMTRYSWMVSENTAGYYPLLLVAI
jgi:hypothetical protein